MKKVLASKIFLVVLTALICISGTVYATIRIQADEIGYKDGTVEDVLNDLYTKANITITNLETKLDKYDSLNIGVRVDARSTKYHGLGLIYPSTYKSKYKYFKITTLTTDSYVKSCTIQTWISSTSSAASMKLNTEYNTSEYQSLYATVLSNKDGYTATCEMIVNFYN